MVTDYAKIEARMKLWRKGLISIPKEYIDYHKLLAEGAIAALVTSGWKVYNTELLDGGWLDGMKNMVIVVETPHRELKKLTWHDSHSRGAWMEVYPSGGAGAFNPEEHMKKVVNV